MTHIGGRGMTTPSVHVAMGGEVAKQQLDGRQQWKRLRGIDHGKEHNEWNPWNRTHGIGSMESKSMEPSSWNRAQ